VSYYLYSVCYYVQVRSRCRCTRCTFCRRRRGRSARYCAISGCRSTTPPASVPSTPSSVSPSTVSVPYACRRDTACGAPSARYVFRLVEFSHDFSVVEVRHYVGIDERANNVGCRLKLDQIWKVSGWEGCQSPVYYSSPSSITCDC